MELQEALNRTVLVVDDDAAIRDMLTEVLEDSGYTVITAANGQDALMLLYQTMPPPRVILLDLMMPIMTGWAFREVQQVDQRLAEIPVIILSARTSLEHESIPMTADAFLRKPVNIIHLLAIVEQYCPS